MGTSLAPALVMGGHPVGAGPVKIRTLGQPQWRVGVKERPIGRLEGIKAVLHPEVISPLNNVHFFSSNQNVIVSFGTDANRVKPILRYLTASSA